MGGTRGGALTLIDAITLIQTSTCQLITHQHSRTMKISYMEVEHSKVQDRYKIFNSMLHMGSKDSGSKEVRQHKIRDKGDLFPSKIRC